MPNGQKNTTACIMAEKDRGGCVTSLNDMQLRLAGLEEESIVDGPGLRLTLFTQGCPHHCKGCHNPETHAYDGGKFHTVSALLALYKENPLLQGVTFSGGEPFEQAEPLTQLAVQIHATGGDVVTYTGYTYERLLQAISNNAPHSKYWEALLQQTDILIDGPYVEELRDLELTFRGSANQRILDRAARQQILSATAPSSQTDFSNQLTSSNP